MIDAEGRKQKAIRLLKQRPFEFIDHGEHRGALPENFHPKLGDADWDKATAVMAVLRSKPATWRWTSETLETIGRLSDRAVRRGMNKLKAEGWVHHAAIFDEARDNLTTFILVPSTPFPEHQRGSRTRFSLLHSEDGWLFGYSRDGGRYTLHDGVGKKRQGVHVHPPYEHISSEDRTLTLKRAEPDFSVPSAAQSETTQRVSPPHAPSEPSENEVNNRKYLARRLEQLGEKRDDSEEAALAYEEFVCTQIIPALELPAKTHKPRRKLESLAWIENSLLGMILLRMSSSPGWNVKCARRVLRRADEGYIQFDDVRILLFAFDWTRARSSRKTLEAMTYFGKNFDHNKGEVVKVDAWRRMISNARETYRRGILGPVLEQRNRLFPQNEDDMEVCHEVNRRVLYTMRDICTGILSPDQKNLRHFGLLGPDALALILSRCGRTEETQKMVDESKDQLETYIATDYAGILIYLSNYHLIPETMGLTLDGIKKRHRAQVDMIQQRLSFHGVATDDIQPLI